MLKQPDDEPTLAEVWEQFCSEVPDDAVAMDIIFNALQVNGSIVCGCASTDVERKPGARIFKCMSCKKETWFTAKTIMKRTERPRAWLAAIRFKQCSIFVGSPTLAKLVEMSQSGAYEIQCKLNRVVLSNIGDDCAQIPSELFRDSICKRSSETPARCHPNMEQSEPSKSVDVYGTDGDTSEFKLSAQTLALVRLATKFIRAHFHGVSRKYLQTYLANFGFSFDCVSATPGGFLGVCLSHPPINREDLINFISLPLLTVKKLEFC